MKPNIVLAMTVGFGLGFYVHPALAGQLEQQVEAQCPSAAAWLNGDHSGLSASQEHALKSIHPSDPALAAQLAKRYARDQAAEQAVIDAHGFSESSTEAMKSTPVKQLLAIQKADLQWLKPIVNTHGFPTVQQVGVEGVEHAWMLVQHADADPDFQVKVLKELKPRLSVEPFLKNNYALLVDRTHIGRHEKQLYGTQFTTKDGRMVMQPTDDVAHLNARRADMNLMPISDYRCYLDVLYHPQSESGASPHASSSK